MLIIDGAPVFETLQGSLENSEVFFVCELNAFILQQCLQRQGYDDLIVCFLLFKFGANHAQDILVVEGEVSVGLGLVGGYVRQLEGMALGQDVDEGEFGRLLGHH